jgi:hypothetical protein
VPNRISKKKRPMGQRKRTKEKQKSKKISKGRGQEGNKKMVRMVSKKEKHM